MKSQPGSRYLGGWRRNPWRSLNKYLRSILHTMRLWLIQLLTWHSCKSYPKHILDSRLYTWRWLDRTLCIGNRGWRIGRNCWRRLRMHISDRLFRSIRHSLRLKLPQCAWRKHLFSLTYIHRNSLSIDRLRGWRLCMKRRFVCIGLVSRRMILENI